MQKLVPKRNTQKLLFKKRIEKREEIRKPQNSQLKRSKTHQKMHQLERQDAKNGQQILKQS